MSAVVMMPVSLEEGHGKKDQRASVYVRLCESASVHEAQVIPPSIFFYHVFMMAAQ